MFHPIGGLTQQEKVGNNTQTFEGTGTPYLRVPGLKRVTAVRLGQLEIPLVIHTEHPVDASDRPRLVSVPQPMVALVPDEDGTPVLLRSMLSNDGIWQDGARIYVTGEWEAVAEPVAAGRGRRG